MKRRIMMSLCPGFVVWARLRPVEALNGSPATPVDLVIRPCPFEAHALGAGTAN
jgi:hypothetical protein